ncbi:MarR family transcriptional regulator [Denitratisoma sp. DHT3]|uniref:MarR family winged helix-turn-helix transcriptional regulator n=1 Tax=Denitratisoma sp. DHT3 TaxID=1981880 RepID=UPI001198B220|nr:MarR family transcriptional regulator [Denitratisoma sp. DHT3]QDX81893.1 MarR family transcriptional regulator [Denitratisoma sp. DHT3]
MSRNSEILTKADFERLAHFRYGLRRFLRRSEELCRKQGLTPLQYQALLQIGGIPGKNWATVGELAERLQAHPHGVVSLVTRCEALGLVERRVGRSDRRQVEVHLTANGLQELQALAQLHQPELRMLQAEFSLPGWQELEDEAA